MLFIHFEGVSLLIDFHRICMPIPAVEFNHVPQLWNVSHFFSLRGHHIFKFAQNVEGAFFSSRLL